MNPCLPNSAPWLAMCSTTVTKLLKLAIHPHLFLIKNCKNMKHLMKFHAYFITNGLSNDPLFLSAILSFTSLSPTGNLAYAHLVFNQIKSPNTFMFNTMIRGYASSFNPSKAMIFYVRMLQYGVFPNHYTYPFVIKALSRTQNYILGEALHCSVVKFGHVLDLHIANSLLHMYASFGFFDEIMYLFDEMPEPDVVSWNVVIDDLVKNGAFDEVLAVVNEMCWNGVEPNAVTLLRLVSCGLKMGDFGLGKLIHLYVLKRGIQMSENLGNGLIDMYAKFGDTESAEKLFDRMEMKTVFSWTSLLDGFIQKGELERAGVVFDQMPKDTTAWNVMLNGYSEGCDMSSAESIFRAMPDRDIVSWNTMILGYTQNKKYMKSLELLREMLWCGLRPDRITLVGLFSVCGYAGVLHIGEAIHSIMEKQNIKEEEVEVALLDMYSKCGDPEKALAVFYAIQRRSVLAWTNMIVGVAMNGLANEALMLFHQMCDEGTSPNEITFLGVLCACSYAGLVQQGKWLFNAMSKVHGITPRSEHYGCMVDLLGRAGLLKEAEMFIQDMPEKADAGIWGALLGACRMHGEVQMGEKIAKIVTQMDPNHSGRYILLSNIYAAVNRWLDAEKVRKKMKTEGVHKTPGFSLVEMKGEMHQFIVGNHS